MKLFPLLSALLLAHTSNVLAISKNDKMHRLVRRWSLEDCTKDMVSQVWNIGRPSNATAAVCYHGGYDSVDWSPTYYHSELTHYCTVKHLFETENKEFTCFYLLGSNVFTAKDDGGYENLAMEYSDKCDWNSGEKRLTCNA